MFPSVSPHERQVPNSIWNLSWRVWGGIAKAADDHLEQMKKERNG